MDYPKFAGKYSKTHQPVKVINPVVSGYNPRETPKYPSKSTPGGDTVLKLGMQYTGEKMVGISIIHKSCLQPIFSEDSAKEVAAMRR